MEVHPAIGMNNVARQYLCQVVRQHGPDVLRDGRRFAALLAERCGDQLQECAVLLLAHGHDTTRELRARHDSEPWETLVTNLTSQLTHSTGLDEETARWAVESWRGALLAVGVIHPPGKRKPTTAPTIDDMPAPDAALFAMETAKTPLPEPTPVVPSPSDSGPPSVDPELLKTQEGLLLSAELPEPALAVPVLDSAPELWTPDVSELAPLPLRPRPSRRRSVVLVIVALVLLNVAIVAGALLWKMHRQRQTPRETLTDWPSEIGYFLRL